MRQELVGDQVKVRFVVGLLSPLGFFFFNGASSRISAAVSDSLTTEADELLTQKSLILSVRDFFLVTVCK
jgi:hypothetical protein